MMEWMGRAFISVLNMSMTASIVILLVMVVRLFLRRAPKVFSYLLWAVVLFRLLCPFSFSSSVSLLGIMRMPVASQGQMGYIPQDIGMMEQPSVHIGIPVAENAVNASLPPAAAEASVNPMQIVIGAGAFLWVSGIIIMTIYSVVTYGKLRKKLKLAIWERDNIYYVPQITTPFVCGFFSPRIYLPGRLPGDYLCPAQGEEEKAEKLKEEQEKEYTRYILVHEQTHIKRRDYIWRIVSYFALCIHWFNPLVWLAFFLSGKDMEMSCDEAVIRLLGDGAKKEYSAALLSLASGRRIVLGIPLAFGEGETGSRIKNVLRYRKPARIALGAVAVVCLAAGIVLAANPGDGSGENGTGSVSNDKGTEDVGGATGKEASMVYHGIVSYIDMSDMSDEAAILDEADGNGSGAGGGEYNSRRKVIVIPGIGELEIPDAGEVYPAIEIEYFTGPEEGDLVEITFPEGEEVWIQETYPSAFSVPAKSIVIMGQGFALRRTDSGRYSFTVPWGLAREAKEGDLLEVYYYHDSNDGMAGEERVLLATVPVLSVDTDNYDIWVELSAEEVNAFLSHFGRGIACEIVKPGPGE